VSTAAASHSFEVLMTTPRDVAGTRRDDPRPVGSHRGDAAVPAQTRRDVADAQAAGPAATRRDGAAPGAGDGVAGFPTLPPEVAGRYRPEGLLARQGAEADVFLVTDTAGTKWVLKVYRRDIAPDPQVWAALPHARSRHLVAVRETGATLDGRKFEVMEYLDGGDLRHVAGRGQLDAGALREIVAQLADGLAALHAVRIIHRDLKPENVLVRRAWPLELVLTDFGLARRLDQTSTFSTAARTLLYTAPETFAGHISPARDWWSLGMIVRELATGERPFAGWTEEVIISHLISRPVDLSAVTDPRLALLCRGLLVRDPRDRWGAEQVRQWVDGGSPPVPEEAHADPGTGAVPPFALFGTPQSDPVALAAALEARWDDAARTFFALPDSERWKALKAWLARFDDTTYFAGEARQDLCDELDANAWPPDVKLVRLLTLLDPARPPSYGGVALRPEDLPAVAAQAVAGDPGCTRAVEELWNQQLLPVLAQRSEAGRLAEIDARWRAARAAYERAAVEAGTRVPSVRAWLDEPDARTLALAGTLSGAAAGDRSAQAVDEALGRLRGQLPRHVDWFDDLVAWRDGDPARSLVVLALAPAATAHAEQMVREEEQQREQALARQREWDQKEADRLRGRDAAVGYALRGAAVLLGLWLLFTFVSSGATSGFPILALLIQTAVEIALARGMGRDYHPQYSLVRWAGRASGEVGDFLRYRRGIGCLGIIAVLAAAIALPWVVLTLGVVVHIGWAVHRWYEWQQAHDEQRRVVRGER
jgi:eukaryotic-like serine/threonine-protein kinase